MGYCCCSSRRKKSSGSNDAAKTNGTATSTTDTCTTASIVPPLATPAASTVNVEPFKTSHSTEASITAPTLPPAATPATSSINMEPFKASPSTPASTTAPTLPTPATPAPSKKPPNLAQVQSLFKDVDIASHAPVLIHAIEEILQMATAQKGAEDKPSTSYRTTTTVEKPKMWASFIKSGVTFLKFFDDHIGKLDNKDNFFQPGQGTKVVAEILQQLGQLHWMVGALSIIGYLVSKIQKVSDNRDKCVELLKDMLELARHIQKLGNVIWEEDKLKNALHLIIEGSVLCASQLHSGKLFSFLKTSVNAETLSDLRSKVTQVYRDLTLTTTIAIKQQQDVTLTTAIAIKEQQDLSFTTTIAIKELQHLTLTTIREIKEQQAVFHPISYPISQPSYPHNAVGLDKQLQAVNRLLNIKKTEDSSSMAVVIYGLGGIGKTTLADAVVNKLDLKDYMYTKIELDEFPQNNNHTKLHQQMLKDLFPNYAGGAQIMFRNTEESRRHLSQAFKSETDRPVFLFVDNALRAQDLEMLLPEDLQGLPQHSRFLITTRQFNITDTLKNRGLPRSLYLVEPLQDEDAKKVVCDDPERLVLIKDDVERIVNICKGIPLLLKIVGARLRKHTYDVDKCSLILEALQKGKQIKQDDVSKRLFDFVYEELEESTQEAFLDICCFFHIWKRQDVENIVGFEEVTSLEEAALITPVMKELRFQSGEEECLIVHDVIRAIGRNMSFDSRIMNAESLNKAAKDEGRLKKLKGVWIKEDDESPNSILEEKHLDSMEDSLRVVGLEGSINIGGRSKKTFQELRFIKLGRDVPSMPLDIEGLDKLAVLHLSGDLLSQQTSPLVFPKTLRVLKIQQLSELPDLSKTVPNFPLHELDLTSGQCTVNALNSFLSGFDKLKILRLDGWRRMHAFPEQVCRLLSLSKLSVRNCYNLMRLPESFGELKTLTHLDLSECWFLQGWPSTFGKLEALEHLNLADCYALEKLPAGIEQLRSLKYLNLRNCECLEELPAGFEQLTAMKYLNLSNCGRLRSDICQKDNLLKIVKKSEHACIDCKKGNTLAITIVRF